MTTKQPTHGVPGQGQSTQSPPTMTRTDRMRRLMSQLTDQLGLFLHRLGVHPDTVTIVGLLLTLCGAILVGLGYVRGGGVVLLLALPFDAIDGAVARAGGRADRFGEMLDSSLDRYADGFIFGALSYYFAVQDEHIWMLCALAALVGSFMVSYTRARGEGVNVDVKIGLFSRLERVIVILVMLLWPTAFGLPILEIGVLVLAVGTNFTGLQRLWYVYRALKRKHGEG
ncbi:MAG: CDP-alcohol phosphatidyltransferase family protein [Chloroflexi bacterium AL-W]|nr:CDP-alcohol phosphatidyltransferase family protein [Chloroflexi bacterium AL-W]